MDIDQVKSQFPIFRQKTPTGKDLIYLELNQMNYLSLLKKLTKKKMEK